MYIPDSKLGRLGLLGGMDAALVAVEDDVQPVSDLLTVSLGDAQHLGDDLHGERSRPLPHQIERLGLPDGVGKTSDHPSDHGFELIDGPWSEYPAHESPQAIVLGWVHIEDHLVGDSTRITEEVEVGPETAARTHSRPDGRWTRPPSGTGPKTRTAR